MSGVKRLFQVDFPAAAGHRKMPTAWHQSGIEAYTGYEYLDIGSTQTNGLVGGVRLWF